MYQLIRTTPDGEEKPSSFYHDKKHQAANQAAQSLRDNCGIPRAEASRVFQALHELPLGETLDHTATGYKLRIEKV